MPITPSDIAFRLSGGASNAVQAASLGGAKSSYAAATTIFDRVSGDEAAAGEVEYRCIYVHNAHGSLTLDNAVAWVASDTTSPSTVIAVGVGSSVMNGIEQSVTDEDTAPTGVTFLPAVNKAGGTALGSIPPGQSRALWLRRTVAGGAAPTASDPFVIRVEGETVA